MNILENHKKQVQVSIAKMQDLIEKLRIMEEAFLKQEEAIGQIFTMEADAAESCKR